MFYSIFCKNNTFRRKGQLNIDYLFAFFILALSIVYASTIALDSIGPFYSSIDRNNLRAEAWIFSERFMDLIETEDHVINEVQIYSYAENKTELRDSLDENYRYRQKIEIDQYPVVITRDMDGYNHTGSAIFNKTYDPFTVNLTVRNTTSLTYTTVDAEADVLSFGLYESDTLLIAGMNYTLSRIDPDGNFVVFERTILSYGWGSMERNMVTVNRYSVLDGFFAKVKIMYF
ncbi:MAG: hypothetical protein KAR51_01210 [Candidatus Aenigmarchaeota archaeon]|nr:hypothetical protein [Candidatus Aenigmarchaeota archaeon]